jgi:hypothetical protein
MLAANNNANMQGSLLKTNTHTIQRKREARLDVKSIESAKEGSFEGSASESSETSETDFSEMAGEESDSESEAEESLHDMIFTWHKGISPSYDSHKFKLLFQKMRTRGKITKAQLFI